MSNNGDERLGEWLTAYLDGELNAKQEVLIERRLQEDASARRLLEDLRRTADLVSSLPRHPAPSSIAEDVQLHVERSELLGGLGEERATGGGPRRALVAFLSMAAAIAVLVVGLRIMVGDRKPGPGARDDVIAMAPAEKAAPDLTETGDAEGVSPTTRRAVSRREAAKKRGAAKSVGGRGAVGEQAATPDRIAPPGRLEESGLLATADFNRKLKAGLGMGSIRDHSFANETVRLNVTVKDEAQRDAVTERLVAYLETRRIGDLGRVLRDEPARAASTGSFYYAGRPSVNFTEAGERQLLVRGTRRGIDGMIDELGRCTSTNDSVALAAGSLSVQGLERARTVLFVLDEPAPVVETPPGTPSVADADRSLGAEAAEGGAVPSDETTTHTDDVLDELLKTIGLDREVLTDLSTPDEDVTRARIPDRADADAMDVKADESLRRSEQAGEAPHIRTGSGPGVTQAETTIVAVASGKGERKGVVLEEPPSLVDKRLEALEKARHGDILMPEPAPSGVGEAIPIPRTPTMPAALGGRGIVPQPIETYVTLVVQVKIAQSEPPTRAEPTRRARETGRSTSPPGSKVKKGESSEPVD